MKFNKFKTFKIALTENELKSILEGERIYWAEKDFDIEITKERK